MQQDIIPKVFLQEYLGWSIFKRGPEFFAIPTRMQKANDVPPVITGANVETIMRTIAGDDLFESGTI